MTLRQCTKEELLYIFKQLKEHYLFNLDYHINLCLSDIEYQRDMKKIDEGRKIAEYSAAKRKEYAKILEPYDGKKFANIPLDVLRRADTALKKAQEADKKYQKLMGL